MSLSVIIPTRNRKIQLKKLVNYLLNNFREINRIIIVDSSDNLVNKANFLNNSKVIYISSDIKSAAIQRNIGLSYLKPKCKFVAFLDDDVRPPLDYFKKLILLLQRNNVVGASGIALNPKNNKSFKKIKAFDAYRAFFYLDSKKEGIVLNSGINIPFAWSPDKNLISESKWLIGCAVWDYQKIKTCQFDNRFIGQSLGEDVLFSLKASKYGKLLVNRNLVLKHLESNINRPNYLNHTRMWVRNRFYISEELIGNKMKISYHWCNFGRLLTIFFYSPKYPAKFLYGLIGIILGYIDLIKDRYAR